MIARLGLSERDRRTLLVGLSVVASLFVVARGIPTLRSWEVNQESDAKSAGQQLVAFRAGLRTLPALRDTTRSRRDRLARFDSSMLRGASPPALVARLASALEDIADDNSIKVTTMQLRADSAVTAGLARVEVRITGTTDVVGLGAFLRAVESDATPMVVRDLSVSQSDPTASDNKPEVLRVEVVVATIGAIKSGQSVNHP